MCLCRGDCLGHRVGAWGACLVETERALQKTEASSQAEPGCTSNCWRNRGGGIAPCFAGQFAGGLNDGAGKGGESRDRRGSETLGTEREAGGGGLREGGLSNRSTSRRMASARTGEPRPPGKVPEGDRQRRGVGAVGRRRRAWRPDGVWRSVRQSACSPDFARRPDGEQTEVTAGGRGPARRGSVEVKEEAKLIMILQANQFAGWASDKPALAETSVMNFLFNDFRWRRSMAKSQFWRMATRVWLCRAGLVGRGRASNVFTLTPDLVNNRVCRRTVGCSPSRSPLRGCCCVGSSVRRRRRTGCGSASINGHRPRKVCRRVR